MPCPRWFNLARARCYTSCETKEIIVILWKENCNLNAIYAICALVTSGDTVWRGENTASSDAHVLLCFTSVAYRLLKTRLV